MCAQLHSPNNLLILHQIINKSDFPCLAGEVAEPCPDINIKFTAFTESKKFYYTIESPTFEFQGT